MTADVTPIAKAPLLIEQVLSEAGDMARHLQHAQFAKKGFRVILIIKDGGKSQILSSFNSLSL